MVNNIVPEFDLGRSHVNVKSGKVQKMSSIKSLEIYIQNWVGTLLKVSCMASAIT